MCCCCKQVNFKNGVHALSKALVEKITNAQLQVHLDRKVLTTITSDADSEEPTKKHYLCGGCFSSLKKSTAPKFSPLNVKFNQQPAVLTKLNELEATLVALNIPFMTMFTRKVAGGQWAMQGPVTNVPADVYETQGELPRVLSQTHSILLNLKKKLIYRTLNFLFVSFTRAAT